MMEKQVSTGKKSRLKKAIIYVICALMAALVPLFVHSVYYLHILILIFIYIIVTSSLRTIANSGQISLGHASFMGIGAYTSAVLAKQLGWTPWITMPLGGFATMAIAILVGYPFSRLRTIYFSMVSLFFGIGMIAVNTIFSKVTGGYFGLIGIWPLFGRSKVPYYYFFLGLTLLCLLILHRLENCRIGMSLRAIDQSHEVAASVGINEAGYRVLALAVGCFVAGLAGAGYAHYNLVLSQGSFDLLASINLLVYMMVGGVGSFAGPVIGAAVLIFIPELFRGLKQFTPYVFAGVLLLVIFVMPRGFVGLPAQIKSWINRRREAKEDRVAS
jgi:branched-chain amino acid transport system permease protein